MNPLLLSIVGRRRGTSAEEPTGPAAVNVLGVGSNVDSTVTTGAVTPGGANRAVWGVNLSYGDTYSDEVRYTNSGGTPITFFVGADAIIDIFGFTFAHAKSFGAPGSPDTSTTIWSGWPATPSVTCAGFIFLENVDQTTPFGTEQLGTEEFLDTSPEAVDDTRTGLTADQLVIGAMPIFSLGELPPTSYTAGGDIEEIIGSTVNVTADSRHIRIIFFYGYADGSGNFNASISVTWPNSGELIIGRIITIPVNDA